MTDAGGQPTKSERLLALEDALERSALDPVELITLHDEEILALDDGLRVAMYPSVDVTDPRARGSAAERGAAALAVRDDPYDPVDVLRLTRSWRTAVVLEQQSADAHAHLCAYLRADGYGSIEDVQATGVHRFVAAKRAACLDLVVQTATPLGDPPVDPLPPRRVTERQWQDEVGPALGDARLVSVVHVLQNPYESDDPDRPASRRAVVYAMPDRTVAVEPDEGGGLLVQQVARATLRRRLHELSTADLPTIERSRR